MSAEPGKLKDHYSVVVIGGGQAGLSMSYHLTRQYQFVRESDHATVMQGHTQWVCIDMKTGRPKKQPSRFVEAYRALN